MSLAVVLFSTFPLAISFANASKAPFLFATLMNFSAALAGLCFLTWTHTTKRKNKTLKETSQVVYSKIYSKPFFWLLVANFRSVFFAISLLFIDVAVASVLLAIQPFITATLIERFFKKDGRYQKITLEKWLLFVFAFIGAGFVIASQSQSFTSITTDLLNKGAIIGILLVVLSVFVGGAASPYSMKLGNAASKKTKGGPPDELFFTIAFMVVTGVIAAVVFFAMSVATNETINDIKIFPAIVYGSLAFAVTLFSRIANLKTSSLSINALPYASPIITLIWLSLASLINVPHFDWLVIGASAIIISNLLLNFKADTPPTDKTLIILLWLLATALYLT